MKKRLIFLLLCICLVLSVLASCDNNETPITPGDTVISGDYIFKRGENVTIVASSAELDSANAEEYNELYNELDAALISGAGITAKRSPDTDAKVKHEIILGKCDRELSRQAYRELEKLTISGNDTKFLIYSNGLSAAIAYYEDDTYVTPRMALEYFIENYINGKNICTMKVGIEYSSVFSLTSYYQQRDDAIVEQQWTELEEKIRAEMFETMGYEADVYVKDVISALRDLYKMYNDNVISWFANLLEPAICICDGECENTKYCGGAGFYYSNSGRDTTGFLPDAETTAQTLGFIQSTGMLDLVNGDIRAAFTDELAAGFVRFAKGLQDEETGYFYHPQWNKDEIGASRRARDLTYACSVLYKFGSAPTYNAPNGTAGDGILYDGTPVGETISPASALTKRFIDGRASAVSSAVKSVATASYPSYMENDVSYKAYLATLDIKTNSYSVGNQLASTASQLIARQKQLSEEGASYNLISITDEWFRKNQNLNTGTWDYTEPGETGYDPYYANDGVLKISAWYNDVGRAYPNPELAAANAIRAITSDQDIEHVCNLYNTWFAINNLKQNVRKYGSAEVADKFISDLRAIAPDGIRKSREKIADHQKADGSFSYFRDHSSQTSQGMPVAVADSNEGDVNATVIATYGLIENLFGALDFGEFPRLYTDADRREFLSIVSELGPVIKNGEIDPAVPTTFDNYGDGDSISKEEFGLSNNNPKSDENPYGTYFVAKKDERPDAYGNVLEYHSAAKVDSSDYISLMSTTGTGGNTWAFSLDLNLQKYIENECAAPGNHRTAADGDAIYINMGGGLYDNNVYMIVLRVREVGGEQVIGIWDASSDNSKASVYNHITDVPMQKWFNLKVEYYHMPSESGNSMRSKIYVDNKVVFVSDNYFDRQGDKITGTSSPSTVYNRVWVSTVDRNETTLLMDNFAVYKFRKNYTVESLPIEKNVDGAGNPEKIHDFEDLSFEDEISLVDNVAWIDGSLKLSNGKIFVPANIRSIRYNRASFEADITVNGSVGEAGYLLFFDNTDDRESIMKIIFKIGESGGKQYVQLYEAPDGVQGEAISGARFDAGENVKLRVDYFDKEDKSLIYINGVFIEQSAAKFGEVNKLTYGGASIACNKNYTISVDNVITDYDTCEFLEAPGIKIDIPEMTETFDNGAGNATLVGGASVSDGLLKLKGKGAGVKLIPSIRSLIGQCYILSADISLLSTSIDGDLLRIALKSSDGKTIFAVEAVADDEYINIYEYGAGGRYPLVIAKGKKNETLNIRIEYYKDTDKANIYINGIGVATTSISYNESSPNYEYGYAEITSIGIDTTCIDNLTADGLYRSFAFIGTAGDVNQESGKQKVTFDYALDNNIPTVVTGRFNTYGAGVSVKQLLKLFATRDEYSKVIKYTMSSGGNDELLFHSSDEKSVLTAASSTVFEGEFMVETGYQGTLWQIIFGDSKKGLVQDAAYMLGMSANASGEVTIYEESSTNGANSRGSSSKYVANCGQWFKLRVEYYKGDEDSLRVKVFVNDKLLLVSDNYYRDYNKEGSPKNYFNQVNFYGQSKSYGTLYFDNISFYANDGATCTDAVTETYTYGLGAKEEYMR